MRVHVPDNVIFETLDAQLVLLNLDTSHYFNVTGSGARIWELIQEKGDTDEVRAAVVEEYAADEATLRRDLETFLGELEKRGLIVVERASSP